MTIAQILSAARILSSLTFKEVSSKTGIPISRISQLFSGQIAPSPNEFTVLMAALGVEATALTSLSAMALSGSVNDLMRNLVLHHQPALEVLPERDACNLVIDRLSFTFNLADDSWLPAWKARYGFEVHHPKRRGDEYFRYRESYKEKGGALFQHRSYEGRTSRFECTPTKQPSWIAIRKMLSRATEVKVSRIDIAVDIPCPIAQVHLLANTQRKVNMFLGPKGIETYNLGTRTSPSQITVYDRQLEQRERCRPDMGPMTRFEAKLRNRDSLHALLNIENPFSPITVLRLEPVGLPLEQRLLINYACTFGLPALKAALAEGPTPQSQKKRTQYAIVAKQVRTLSLSPPVTLPQDVFAAKWKRVLRCLIKKLNA